MKTSALAGAGLALTAGRSVAQSERAPIAQAPGVPLVVSTWRTGVEANPVAVGVLTSGGTALDAVQHGVMVAEADVNVHSVGIGGYPNSDGVVELDAAIMDGSTLEAGSVAGLQDIKHPVAVARLVMEKTPHVMLVGAGARRFALEQGFEAEDLVTPEMRAAWEQRNASQLRIDNHNHDTMGMIAMGINGHMAVACTTSGSAWKLPGRVGDSPLIGAGLYADDAAGAATGTGLGEEVIKACGAYQIVEFMRQGLPPTEAIERVLARMVRRKASNRDTLLAFVAMRADGEIGYASTVPYFQACVSRGEETRVIDVARWSG